MLQCRILGGLVHENSLLGFENVGSQCCRIGFFQKIHKRGPVHRPIVLKDLSFSLPHKTCFEGFSTIISPGDRIAVIGRNGSGKSSLLRLLQEQCSGIPLAFVPQERGEGDTLSGGEGSLGVLARVFKSHPSILLLDEPTNHLDRKNRESLRLMLKAYRGTLVVATHDRELLQWNFPILWPIEGGAITVFRGQYEDFQREHSRRYLALTRQKTEWDREKKSLHGDRMREQERISKSRSAGKKKIARKRWTKSAGDLKAMRAEKSQNSRLREMKEKGQALSAQLRELRLPEEIVPRFGLLHRKTADRTLVSVVDGAIGYAGKAPILSGLHFSVAARERWALIGCNGSGKTTLLRAILGDLTVKRQGHWHILPARQEMGFLDQHYRNLEANQTAMEVIAQAQPSWGPAAIRQHLNAFLFRKNEEVGTPVHALSGGEKARLSLAQISANPPKLLILDEITNNLDRETRDHVRDILRAMPAALIVVSHEEQFLEEIEVEATYQLA
ncbi:MAG: ATP-binding cassette domain-containing protein [Holosporales bacterium]|jgi:ATPase subunit of ABC transporter with duplicated ATPase domains|nr:ATP-binding cassette domain-containing protein [Holosporales bacterium]